MAMPFIAKLSDSVPPDVKTISEASVPIALPIVSLEDSTALRADWPFEWTLEALPYSSEKYGIMASSTSLRRGVVALWSKYICLIIFIPMFGYARQAPGSKDII